MTDRLKIEELLLLQIRDRKSGWNQIVASCEKWIYFQKTKRKKSWGFNMGQPSTSAAKRDPFCWKAIAYLLGQKTLIGIAINIHKYTYIRTQMDIATLQSELKTSSSHTTYVVCVNFFI